MNIETICARKTEALDRVRPDTVRTKKTEGMNSLLHVHRDFCERSEPENKKLRSSKLAIFLIHNHQTVKPDKLWFEAVLKGSLPVCEQGYM